MVAANSLNISEVGFQSFDGVSVFKGRTLTAGAGISITNGTGVLGNPTISLVGGGTAIQTVNGDTGSITGSTVTIFSNNATLNAGQSVSFVNSGSVSTLNVTDASFNTVIGKGAGKLGQTYNTTTVLGALAGAAMTSAAESVFIGAAAGNAVTSAQNNTFVGGNSGAKVTTGSANTAVGLGSLFNATTGAANAGSNVAIGYNSLSIITTGTFGIALGASAGSGHTTSDSSNIDIGNTGTAGQSNVIRIGTQGTGSGQQNTAFMAGITGATAAGSPVAVSSTGQLSDLGFGNVTQVLTSNGAGVSPTWATPTTGTVTSVSGTLNRITSTGGATPVIDISASYVGQSSITTLGTIATGVWNGTAIDATHGGTAQTTWATGDILYASGVNTLAKLTAGSNTQVLTLAGGVPTWATPTAGTVTSVSGTLNRITSTGGATPVIDISASYVGQSSITTLGTIATGVWNGTVIDLAHGGTNANLTASNGGIFYSTSTAGAILSGTATAGQILRSGSSAAPSWSTATYPATAGTSGKILISDGTNIVSSTPTYPNSASGTGTLLRADGTNWVATTSTYPDTNAVSTLLYASSANVMSALATANSGVLSTNSSGVPSIDTTNFAVLSTGLQLKGNNTNTASPAGFLGQLISSNILTGSAVSLSNGISKTITSISVTAGNWMITGVAVINTGTTQSFGIAGISTTNDTLPTLFNEGPAMSSAVGNKGTFICPNVFVSLSGTTTYYLVVQSGFTAGTSTGYGNITAIRIG